MMSESNNIPGSVKDAEISGHNLRAELSQTALLSPSRATRIDNSGVSRPSSSVYITATAPPTPILGVPVRRTAASSSSASTEVGEYAPSALTSREHQYRSGSSGNINLGSNIGAFSHHSRLLYPATTPGALSSIHASTGNLPNAAEMAYLKKISDLELTVVSLKSEIAALRDDNKKYGRDSGGGASRGGTHFEHFDGDVEFGDGYTSLSTHSTTSIASSSNNNATQYAGLLKGCKTPFWASVYDRCSWLVMLLIFQSFSSIILVAYEGLLAAHSDIIFFLTMLVGAGGNAGNQAAVRAIRGIALGSLNVHTRNHFLRTEIGMAFTIACIVGIFGFLRAVLSFRTTFMETIAITTALVTIVFISIATGASLPFVLQYLRADPAHSSTTIQVIMDILGVLITCAVATVMLGTSDASTSGGGPAGTGAFTTGASVVGVTKSQGMGVVG